MRIKIVLSIFAVTLLTGGLFPTAFAATGFTDVGTAHPNYKAITELQNLGVIQGYPDGTFKPEQVVNRVEALKIILGGSGIDVSQAIGVAAFADTSATEWYAKYLKKAVDLNIVQGYPDGTFKPAQTVNLVESLKILLNTNEADFSATTVSGNPYADAYANQWYSMYVQYAKDNALIDADGANRVYPDGGMTRAKLAEAMYRLMQLQGDSADADEPAGEPQSTTLTEEIVMELLDNLFAAETLDEKNQYLSAAKEAQLKNLVTMVSYRDPSDPFYAEFEGASIDTYKSLIAADNLPYLSYEDIVVSELDEVTGYNKAVIQVTDVSVPANAALCVGLVYEESKWKFDSYSVSYLEALEDNCLVPTEMPEILTDADLTMAALDYSSEYESEVYLNDHLVFSGGMKAGTKTMGFPINDGDNSLLISIGDSLKETIMNSLGEDDGFWMLLGQSINGFQFALTVGEDTLVDEDITGENQDKYVDFTFSK